MSEQGKLPPEPPVTEKEIELLTSSIIKSGTSNLWTDYEFLRRSRAVGIIMENIIAGRANQREALLDAVFIGYRIGRIAATKQATQDFAEINDAH